MKNFLFTASFAMMASAAGAQTHEIPLWPHGTAESNRITAAEERDGNWNVFNVSEASIYVWPACEAKNTGQAILICPGGGYGMQAAGHEGKQFAEWLSANGITAVVLKYRLPNGHSEIPVTDAREAVRVIRRNAAKWGVDPAKVGVMGFSAGGHLASTLLTQFDEGSRPDFGILFYPVVSLDKGLTHQGTRDNLLGKDQSPERVDKYSNDKQVTKNTPPTLIFFSDDDVTVDPRNGTMFYEALKANGVRSAMYVYPDGGHGWGFHDSFKYHGQMKGALLDWLAGF